MQDLSIREERPEDLPALARLFWRAFGHPLDETEWRWKYDQNPFGRCGVVAERAGELVAFYGGWWWRVWSLGKAFSALSITDTMSDPAVRLSGRRPVIVAVQERFLELAAARGASFCFGFPNEQAARFGRRFFGYVLLGRLPVLEAELLSLPESDQPLVALEDEGRLRIGETFPPSHDELSAAIHSAPGWRTDKTAEALNWRYYARPNIYYRVYHLGPRAEKWNAYAVARTVGPLAQLVDLQTVGQKPEEALETLLGTVRRDLLPRGITRIEVGLASGPLADALGRMGFSAREGENRFGVRPIDPATDAVAAGRALELRYGDLDVF